MGMGWMVRHREAVTGWAEWAMTKNVSEQPERSPPSLPPKGDVRPFVIQRSGVAFSRLTKAVAAAEDGDTIRIQAEGNLTTGSIDLRGKALILMAASGARPILHFAPSKDAQARQAFLTVDRPLILHGLELVLPAVSEQSFSAPAVHLIYCQDTSLQISGCLLRAPGGHSPLVCRKCSEVKLLDSEFVAAGSVL